MTLSRPVSITAVSAQGYDFVFEEPDHQLKTYTFVVDSKDGIDVVVSSQQFQRRFRLDTPFRVAVSRSVLTFHQARTRSQPANR